MIHSAYVEYLKDSTFKILPLFEERNEGIFKYINSLLFEINGLQYVVNENNQKIISSLISNLESLLDESICSEYDLELIRREVFKCIGLVDKLQMKGD